MGWYTHKPQVLMKCVSPTMTRVPTSRGIETRACVSTTRPKTNCLFDFALSNLSLMAASRLRSPETDCFSPHNHTPGLFLSLPPPLRYWFNIPFVLFDLIPASVNARLNFPAQYTTPRKILRLYQYPVLIANGSDIPVGIFPRYIVPIFVLRFI